MIDLDFPRVSLCHRPTPLEAMPRLSEHLGGPALFVKRDDCTGLAGGGNKTRKLEFLAGAALQQGANTLVTTGGIQSNHARQTAAAAAKLGLRCELVLPNIVERNDEQYQNGVLTRHGLDPPVRLEQVLTCRSVSERFLACCSFVPDATR